MRPSSADLRSTSIPAEESIKESGGGEQTKRKLGYGLGSTFHFMMLHKTQEGGRDTKSSAVSISLEYTQEPTPCFIHQVRKSSPSSSSLLCQ
jgi:hypothetical protein